MQKKEEKKGNKLFKALLLLLLLLLRVRSILGCFIFRAHKIHLTLFAQSSLSFFSFLPILFSLFCLDGAGTLECYLI